MKFYIPNDKIDQVNEEDCKWLNPADFQPHKRSITLYEYSNGWIFEAEESFNSFFKLITGKKLPTITDAEYAQFVLDKVAFFSKDRAEQFRTAWAEFLPKKR
jgi:hypothetical protein